MKHFELKEFDSPDSPGSGIKMNREFLAKLDFARDDADIPFIITSGYRTKEHNERVGGIDSSAHTKGYAADIACRDSRSRHIIVTSLILAGFDRIGIANTFIHVDSCPEKPKNVIWVY